ncbi:DoxX family protein [Sporomusa sphaeroides]|uniref:DoxX n=1 Tax=Sporomusa sphaeroides DSM 2875 TaxID=1337886 RepID=A0ABM9W8N2_9FIRM|nr:DoxX family protein [Sporomusa sphaeroides]OLS55249.1 DoxX [Sporomusa sphaeroides DSM 2875]CVK21525.1 DoxX [Sporomusa sphaeroides DSM 2875]
MKQLLQKLAQFLSQFLDMALLVFRLGLGGMFMWHGWPKIIGGTAKWAGLGKAMGTFGIEFAPVFWGFMASFAEFGGGLLFALGLFYRPACFLLVSNMFVAFSSQMIDDKGLQKASQSLEDGISFFGAAFVGPGKYSLDYYLGIEGFANKAHRMKRI